MKFFEFATFIVPLLLIIASIVWLMMFNLRSGWFGIEKIIGLLLLTTVLIGAVLLEALEIKSLGDANPNPTQVNERNGKSFDYGTGGKFIIGVISALLLSMVAIGTFDALKAKNEERNREEKLNNSARCVERLTQSKLYNESFDISKNLFEDIFKEFNQNKSLKLSDPICTAYLSNLEVYAQCRLEHGGIENELKNLIAVNNIYEELVQTLYQSTIWPKESISSAEWKERTRVFVIYYILGKKNDEKYTVHTFLWHERFLNCWADVLIRLSHHAERARYLAQAEVVLGWARVVFEVAENEDRDGEIHNCLEFILERIKYHRLRGDLFHEKNHIAEHQNLTSYKRGLPNEEGFEDVEHEYRLALSWVSSLAFSTGRGGKLDTLPALLDYQPNPSLSACPPQLCDWKKVPDSLNTAHSVDSLMNRLHKGVKLAIKKGVSPYYLWSDIERCKTRETKIRKILGLVEKSSIKPIGARKPNMDGFLDALQIETTKIYLKAAQNSIRYIAEANERNAFLPDDEYENSDMLINRALGRARSLIEMELSWKHSVMFYNNLGVYLTEKGHYEKRLCNTDHAEKLYTTALRIHEMIQSHLIEGSDDVADIAKKHDNGSESEWYNKVDNLLYLRNLIDLGRTHQHLYQLRCEKKRDDIDNCMNLSQKNRKDFLTTRCILRQALTISTKTENFICRAEAHLALADLYAIDRCNWGSAIIAYRFCLETFTKEEYKAYRLKATAKLSNLYADHHKEIDKVQRAIFIKSFNLCADFDNEDRCERYRLKGNFHQHIHELFMQAPDECPEITCGRCRPCYWCDI